MVAIPLPMGIRPDLSDSQTRLPAAITARNMRADEGSMTASAALGFMPNVAHAEGVYDAFTINGKVYRRTNNHILNESGTPIQTTPYLPLETKKRAQGGVLQRNTGGTLSCASVEAYSGVTYQAFSVVRTQTFDAFGAVLDCTINEQKVSINLPAGYLRTVRHYRHNQYLIILIVMSSQIYAVKRLLGGGVVSTASHTITETAGPTIFVASIYNNHVFRQTGTGMHHIELDPDAMTFTSSLTPVSCLAVYADNGKVTWKVGDDVMTGNISSGIGLPTPLYTVTPSATFASEDIHQVWHDDEFFGQCSLTWQGTLIWQYLLSDGTLDSLVSTNGVMAVAPFDLNGQRYAIMNPQTDSSFASMALVPLHRQGAQTPGSGMASQMVSPNGCLSGYRGISTMKGIVALPVPAGKTIGSETASKGWTISNAVDMIDHVVIGVSSNPSYVLPIRGAIAWHNLPHDYGSSLPAMNWPEAPEFVILDPSASTSTETGTFQYSVASVRELSDGTSMRTYTDLKKVVRTGSAAAIPKFRVRDSDPNSRLEMYDTEANGAILYRNDFVDQSSMLTGRNVQFSGYAVSNPPRLADINGGVVYAVSPGAIRLGAVWEDRIVVRDTFNQNVLKITFPIQPGAPVSLGADLEILAGASLDRATAVAQLGSGLCICYEDKIEQIFGRPPSATGSGSTIGDATLLSASFGSYSQLSTVTHRQSLVVTGNDGTYLIADNRQITKFLGAWNVGPSSSGNDRLASRVWRDGVILIAGDMADTYWYELDLDYGVLTQHESPFMFCGLVMGDCRELMVYGNAGSYRGTASEKAWADPISRSHRLRTGWVSQGGEMGQNRLQRVSAEINVNGSLVSSQVTGALNMFSDGLSADSTLIVWEDTVKAKWSIAIRPKAQRGSAVSAELQFAIPWSGTYSANNNPALTLTRLDFDLVPGRHKEGVRGSRQNRT